MTKWTILAVACGVALLGLIALLKAWPMINIVETGRTPEYPDIQPRRYRASTDRVYDAALHAVNAIPRWAVASYLPDRKEIKAEATSRVFRFVDDVHIRLTAEGPMTVVNVRSASRIGRGDFGQNARNIRALFDELDRQLQGSPVHP